MPKKETFQELALRPRATGTPLFRWFYQELRAVIIEGRLQPGMRLPSTRNLSREYGVARGTVLATFEQLQAEGYVEGRTGSGTYVARNLPDRFLRAPSPAASPRGSGLARRARLSKWGEGLTQSFPFDVPREVSRPFQPNQPALDLFPAALWSQIAGRRLRRAPRMLLNGADTMGYRPLREAIAAHLGAARGVKCSADQVLIVSGTQETLSLAARLLLNPGDQFWMEDPGYIGALAAFSAAGASRVAVPVDRSGCDVAVGERRAPRARLAYLTPAHQFPLGASLVLERRLALLHWARRAGAWIFEDDYDSEYRFVGRPLAALQSLDTSGCVLFAGSFNKMLFPGLRLGYAVLPETLIESFARALSISTRFAPALDQAVLCDFITEGHFGQHIRRMREAYAERLGALLAAGEGPLAGLLDILHVQAGMQTAALLPAASPDRAVALAAGQAGIDVMPLSIFQIRRTDINGLLLGFASASPPQIRAAAERLAKVLQQKKPAPSQS